jgi:tetratricopeptide (TPR) repeat protein
MNFAPVDLSCPALDRWHALLEECVDPSDVTEMETHLETCSTCQESLLKLAGASETSSPRSRLGHKTIQLLARIAAEDLTQEVAGPPLAGSDSEVDFGSPIAPIAQISPKIPGFSDLVEIGRGGMGSVYSASQAKLGRRVAIKVLSSALMADESSRARVLREARLMARLHHPNVVTIHGSGEVDRCPYLVMELVAGGTLQDQLVSGVLPFLKAAEIVRDLALGLGQAHSLGFIHRDLKPSNVLLTRPGDPSEKITPKLADFGLAIAAEDDDEHLTKTGNVVGTPAYMSPEQTGHRPSLGKVGPASDIHGLGAILSTLLTGHSPYRGDSTWEILARISNGQPEPLRRGRPDVPRDLETIVDKCLRYEPAQRYRSAGDLADDLTRFLEGKPVSARPISLALRLAKWARRRPAMAAACLLIGLLVAGGLAGASYHVVELRRAFDRLKHEQAKTKEEQTKTKLALDAANKAREKSRQALETLTDDVIGRMIERGSALNEVDLAFLRKVRGYLEEPNDDGTGEILKSIQSRAFGLQRLGNMFDQISRWPDGEIAYQTSIRLCDDFLKRHPDQESMILQRNQGLTLLLQNFKSQNRHREALETSERLVALTRSCAGRSIADRVKLGMALTDHAACFSNIDRREEGDRVYAEAQAIISKLHDKMPAHQKISFKLNMIYYNRALNLYYLKRFDQAETWLSSILQLAESMRKIYPEDITYDGWLVTSLDLMVGLKLAIDKPEEALKIQRRCADQIRLMASRFPGHSKVLGNQVSSACSSHTVLSRLGRAKESEAELLVAVEAGLALREANPSFFYPTGKLIDCLNLLTGIYEETGRPEQALKNYERVVTLIDPWLKSDAYAADSKKVRRSALMSQGNLLRGMGRPKEAIDRLDLAKKLLDDSELQLSLAWAYFDAGELIKARQAAEAASKDAEFATEVRELLDKIASHLTLPDISNIGK